MATKHRRIADLQIERHCVDEFEIENFYRFVPIADLVVFSILS